MAAFFMIAFSNSAFSASSAFESPATQVSLVELYTSEGCSSCPPANEWVNKLLPAAGLWKKFIPVVFHVDYWDRLGWKDPFSSAIYTQRQEEYVNAWGGSTLYTPGMVLNGEAWSDWSSAREVPGSSQEAGVLKLEVLGEGRFRLEFRPASGAAEKWIVHAALLGFGIESKVTRGENSGRLLKHEFTVLDYAQAKAEGNPVVSELRLTKPSGLAEKGVEPKAQGVTAWVSRASDPTPVQAVGGYL